jgi:alginate O-acetyltransferase complex protein AlgI
VLFNSFQFIFAFLPLTLLAFFLLGRVARGAALSWLILASLAFYALWRPFNVVLIAPSIIINFILARVLLRLRSAGRDRAALWVLVCGIAFNVAFLGYFKYTNFFLGAVDDIFGTQMQVAHIVLPLAISFITFQKIAFLVDVQGGRVESFTLREYCLFVLFFPQLIAGPIVHFREVMPQFRSASCRFDATDTSVALTLFVFGLCKKVILADGLASFVTPLYERAAHGESLPLLSAWIAAVGFTLQIYFDFSGYSEMAIGLARFFGIRLPANFDSPLKSANIIDFWLRWHMTLTRFLTAYIFNPLMLALSRRRIAQGRPGIGRRGTTFGAFVNLLAFPIILTMLISGLWHGAGYTFLLWGLVHGIFLTVNHAWRLVRPLWLKTSTRFIHLRHGLAVAFTYICVSASMLLFRSPTVATARHIFAGMLGMNGVALPAKLHAHLSPLLTRLHLAGIRVDPVWSIKDSVHAVLWVTGLSAVVLLLPNTLQLLAGFEPALGRYKVIDATTQGWRNLLWRPWLPWAFVTSVMAAVAIGQLSGGSEFLYWRF